MEDFKKKYFPDVDFHSLQINITVQFVNTGAFC